LPTKSHLGAPARKRPLAQVLAGLCGAALLAGCTTSAPVQVTARAKPKSTEYFAEKEYGVKASPRVIAAAVNLPGVKARRLPRGGGREQVGKPYKIRGKWYYPKEDLAYDKRGTASWYGAAFHGRKTANGEIYDMNQLSAAHPTMPLPSYARVTNLANGNTLIVRVNDRGPYAHNRLIDMSKRAAEMLDYTGSGTAQVRVQYVGRAPVHGNDDQYLMASYQRGDGGAAPADAMQPNVMVAMAGPTPDLPGVSAPPLLEGDASVVQASAPQDPFALMENAEMPALGPIVPDKPVGGPSVSDTLVSAYADARIASAYAVSAPFKALGLSETRIKATWKSGTSDAAEAEHILLGTFSKAEAARVSKKMGALGRIVRDESGQGISLALHAPGGADVDALLELSWRLGAPDAFVVRK
jgi:rare lipoprotein A